MRERPRTWQQEERRALVADLVRTQQTLQARSDQLEQIFASRWYRLARFFWRLRRGSLRRPASPKLAGRDSFARSLSGDSDDPGSSGAVAPEPKRGAGSVDGMRRLVPLPSLEHPRNAPGTGARGRLLIAGHNLAFCAPIARRARQRGSAVREDRWRTHRAHNEEASVTALAWADTILCEWCLGNAVWYSRNKLEGQRLVVRFHRMELDTSFPAELDLARVDTMVFVAAHVLEQACERWGWDHDDPRFRVVPNGVDAGELRRPKLPGAAYTLGMIGYVPRLKRLDRALDLLETLRAHDSRYRLAVKGREPWEYAWMGARQEDRSYYERLGERLEKTPGLRDAVVFEPYGEDVAEFLRRAGWILSTSEVEGHSVSLAEGMASGSVPLVLARPGATEQYGEEWTHADPRAAAHAILAVGKRGEVTQEGEQARRFGERWSWQRLAPVWDELVAENRPAGEPAGS